MQLHSYQDRYKTESKYLLKSYSFLKKLYSNIQLGSFFYKDKTELTLEEWIHLKKISRVKEKQLFIDYELEVDSKVPSFFIENIIDSAFCISDKVLWLHEPFAWSNNMLDSYNNIYYDKIELIPPTKNNPSYRFLNSKSQAKYMLSQQKEIEKILKNYEEIVLIDLQKFIEKEISKQSDLFLDEVHLSEKGHKVIFDFINPIIKKHLSK